MGDKMDKTELKIIIPDLQKRITAIEKEEYHASKKLYERSTTAINAILLFVAVITFAVPAIQVLLNYKYNDKINEFLKDAKLKIESITGSLKSSEYKIEFQSTNLQGEVILYNHETSMGEVNGSKYANLKFDTKFYIFGKSDDYSELKGIVYNVEWNDKLINLLKNDIVRGEYASVTSKYTSSTKITGLFNSNTPVSVNLDAKVNLLCDEFKKFVKIMKEEGNLGRLVFRPIIANKNGAVIKTTAPFTVKIATHTSQCNLNKNDNQEKK